MHEALRRRIDAYYTAKVRTHGPTAQGVDWSSAALQRLRFEQLLRVLEEPSRGPDDPRRPASASATGSLLDFGCGYGALADLLDERGDGLRYVGYDLSNAMISEARARDPDGRRTFTSTLEGLAPCDWAVASGVLNVKLRTPVERWASYALDVVAELDRYSTHGFAFNALTRPRDPGQVIEELWYADPGELADHCRRTFSPRVTVLDDYGLREFTVLVAKDDPGR